MSTVPANQADLPTPPATSAEENAEDRAPSQLPIGSYIPPGRLSRWYDKLEAFISRLSVRDHFWHRVCSAIWLPMAAFSGIRMKVEEDHAAILPFTRFNRNFYRAMAGGALLAN